jgi:hypothetical protein
MKKVLFGLIVCFVCTLPVYASIYDITMTADNGYGLYAEHNANFSYLGGSKVWNTAETYSHDFSEGDYVYVYAWDWGYAEGFIGQFISRDPNFSNFYTNKDSGWEVMAPSQANSNSHSDDPIPSSDVIKTEIEQADWSDILYTHPKGRARWSSYLAPEISQPADWIWGAVQESEPFYGPSFIFRHKISLTDSMSPVPEPGTILLLGMGLLGIAGISRKYN